MGYYHIVSVYVEVVIINNFALDALLIALTLCLRRRKQRWWRVLLASLLGAGVAVGYGIAPLAWQIAIRILLAPLMCVIFDKYKSFKDFLLSLAVFAFLTFALGGTVYGLSYLIGVDLNGYVITGLCAAAGAAAIFAVRAFKAKRSKGAREIRTVQLERYGKKVAVKALCDTGNALTDTVSGLPVVIASEALEKKLKALDTENAVRIDGYIEVKTISDSKSLPITKLDAVEVNGVEIQAYCALSRQHFDGFEMILQNTMF